MRKFQDQYQQDNDDGQSISEDDRTVFTRDDRSELSGSRSTISKTRPSGMTINQDDTISEAIDGEDKELLEEEEEKEIELPKVLQDSNFTPKVVEEETPLV